MLFTIDRACYDQINSHKDKNALFSYLDSFIKSVRDGNHYLLLYDRSVMEELIKCGDMTPIAINYIKELLHSSSYENRGYYKAVNVFIQLHADDTKMNAYIENVGDKIAIVCHISNFSTIASLVPTQFLCEDINDIDLYIIIAKYYAKYLAGRYELHFPNRYQALPGGGGRIKFIYENEVKRKERLCFCIADTDCRSPYSDISETIKSLREVEENKDNYLTEFYELNTQEIENLLPIKVIEKCFCTYNYCEFIRKIDSSNYRYLDYKKGYAWKNLKDTSKPEVKFWYDILVQQGYINENKLPKDDSTEIIKGFGSSLYKKAVNFMESNTYELDEFLTEHWQNVGRKVFSWFLGSQKNRKK